MGKVVVPAVAIILAFFVGTQIQMMHHLGSAMFWAVSVVVAVLLISVDQLLLQRRLSLWGRVAAIIGVFAAVLVLNSASTLTKCQRGRTDCHRVFDL